MEADKKEYRMIDVKQATSVAMKTITFLGIIYESH